MDDIFTKYQGTVYEGTDKAVTHSYLPTYERIFGPKRNTPVRLLEIGICTGGSLLAWSEYFTSPESEIVGLDVTFEHMTFDLSKDPKVRALLMDARTKTPDGLFDFIIDDGSHWLNDQIQAFVNLKSHLKPGGVYIIEDVYSIEEAQSLAALARIHKFQSEIVDLRNVKDRYDDIMVIISSEVPSQLPHFR